MSNSKNITPTEGRLIESLDKINTNSISNYGVEEKITNAVNDSLIRTGSITKVYPYLDKAEVKLHQSGKLLLCKFLHRFGGELLDLYTPTAESWEFDDKLKERYIIPRGDLHVVVAKLHDEDSDENLLLGFYQNEELVGLNPAVPGNFKITTRGGTNQFWIKFGYNGLDLRLIENSTISVGEMDESMEDVSYALKDDVYTKEEIDNMLPVTVNLDDYYLKSEVNSLLQAYGDRISALEDLVNNGG